MKLSYFDEKHFSQLSYKFKRVLKQKSPQVVVVFFSIDLDTEQQAF